MWTNAPRRTELYLWLFLGFSALLATRLLGLGDFDLFLKRINALDAVSLCVLAVAAWRLSLGQSDTLASHREIFGAFALAVAAVGLAFVPSAVGIGAGLGVLGIAILRGNRGEKNLRAAAICLLALAGHLSIAPIVFRIFLDPILTADRYLLGAALSLIRPETIWGTAGFTAPDGLRIALVGACSSFAGISVAIVVHVGWAMRVRTSLTSFDGLAIIATSVLATTINITRLVLTGWDTQSYMFWHGFNNTAPGLLIAWALQTTVILTGGYLSATWAARGEKWQ